ncbi:DUF1330 domain-containing protein [Chelatococcus reniformis]|uniref:DUF1330 domain-containing protein n=1 Tax=Chelatococcus reniformis TaxID=1494448 RepID=A0A916U3R1_9HYPH|nr:DUF1330 domain-containing protein [Chelatococcus reniformis]GGC58960.1 hypothetical protein GCM10010994_17220 [Chelatococcus reniformis]
MSAYAIFIRDRMIDPDEMTTYSELARKARGDNPPKLLALYGAHETLEGLAADGVVLLEFPDMAAAKAWYNSPAYQEALKHRKRGADYRVVLVEGFTPPPA